MARIRELVLTGGPCAGKTTAIARLADALPTHGWRVLRAPEAATMFLTGGVDDLAAVAADPGRYSRFQRALTAACSNLRASFRAMAEALGDDTLIVYDRAEPDTAAYVDPEAYRDVTARLGTTPEAVRDSYDMVLHLTTAADGAEWAYTTANNAARSESPELARERDRATLCAWFGHPRLIVIDNRGDFEAKMARVVDAALRLLGEPMALEIERKYLLASAPDLDRLAATGPVVTSEITQIYLPAVDGAERRCRRTVCDGAVTYTLTEKRPAGSDEVRHEEERLVGYDVWADAVAGGGATVTKTRRVFVHDGQRFELDEFHSPRQGWLLEIELGSVDDEVRLPPFLDVAREVTDDPAWRNAAIAGAT